MACKGSDKLEKYKQLFKEFDSNGDGFLSIHEFKTLLERGNCKMSDQQIADTFVFFDGPKGDRRITFEEFTRGLDMILAFVQKVTELFRKLDKDGSGCLDRNELKALLQQSGRKFSEDDVTCILKEADKNGDNQISLKEFLDAVC